MAHRRDGPIVGEDAEPVGDHRRPHFVELWRAGRLPVESLVSSTITLDGINAGMDQLADGKAVRQMISFA